jgi:hypothetical protein
MILDLEVINENAIHANVNSTNTHFHNVDNSKDPNKDDYMQDEVLFNKVGEQDNKLDDYDYHSIQEAEPKSDPNNKEDLEDIDTCDLGMEDGENEGYLDSNLEYEYISLPPNACTAHQKCRGQCEPPGLDLDYADIIFIIANHRCQSIKIVLDKVDYQCPLFWSHPL